MATAANDKELAQCLAFAYFAVNPNFNNEKEHRMGFYKLFSDNGFNTSDNKNEYKSHLAKGFDMQDITKTFLKTTTKKKTTKEEEIEEPENLKKDNIKIPKFQMIEKRVGESIPKVYNVAKNFILDKKIIPISSISEYDFLNQQDPFLNLVKDKCLNKILNKFGLGQNRADTLSPIDILIIKRSEKSKITKFFTNFERRVDPLIIDYNKALSDLMQSKEMLPVSLKLPETVKGTPYISVIDYPENRSVRYIDPYLKFLSYVLDRPEKTERMIDQLIQFNFDKFDPKLIWLLPVAFNYTKIIDTRSLNPKSLYPYDIGFSLEIGRSGFNGQFVKSASGGPVPANWTGGISQNFFQLFARTYPKYKQVEENFINAREKVFYDVVKKYKWNFSNATEEQKKLYTKAINILSANKIIHGMSSMEPINNFFLEIEPKSMKQGSVIWSEATLEFMKNIIQTTLAGLDRKMHTIKAEKRATILFEWFKNCEFGHFLFMGGPNAQLHFKKCLFMSIYGLMTKKSYTSFKSIDDYTGMKVYVENVLKSTNKISNIREEFVAPPHYVLS